MERECMLKKKNKLPEVMVFAGPNGSGKTTLTHMAKTVGVYINADDIKKASLINDLDAAIKAEELRELMLKQKKDFTFETVLSTERNLKLLKKAKDNGYFIRCVYVLTSDYRINIARVDMREHMGGHSVPKEKIKSRFKRALNLIPELVEICDIVHIYEIQKFLLEFLRKEKIFTTIGKMNIGVFQILRKLLGLKLTIIEYLNPFIILRII